jgi:hypothetical protein
MTQRAIRFSNGSPDFQNRFQQHHLFPPAGSARTGDLYPFPAIKAACARKNHNAPPDIRQIMALFGKRAFALAVF